ncbi:MAG: GmrSD restriction endonuclease domain-containing protein [Paracoccaceae bacterium]
MFRTHPVALRDLLDQAATGRLALPDFQRSFVWSDEGVRALLASIAQGFPVGALLTLEAGGRTSFQTRNVEGASGTATAQALLLDGQQRITSLHGALWSRDAARVKRGARVVGRHYYLDMAVAVAGDVDAAVVSVPEDRVLREGPFAREIALDLADTASEVAASMFPLDRVFDDDGWWDAWGDAHDEDAKARLRKPFKDGPLAAIKSYAMPVIELSRDSSRGAIVTVFEKVNTGGVKLDAFELLTATYATDGFRLRDDWAAREDRLEGLGDLRAGVLFGDRPWQRIEPLDHLAVCAFLHGLSRRRAAGADRDAPAVSIKRADLLKLPLDAFQAVAGAAEEGLSRAAGFLNALKIVRAFDLPYGTQRVALACMLGALPHPLPAPAAAKVEAWFWAVALGEQYGSSTETLIARDAMEVLSWIDGGPVPRAVTEAAFRESRLDALSTRTQAAYKAIHVLLMREGCRDFVSGDPVDLMTVHDSPMDIHHVFPAAWCRKRDLPWQAWDTIVNKAAIARSTNRSIGGDAPSAYLTRIQGRHEIDDATMDDILRSHLLDPAAMRADDIDAALAHRRAALCDLIGTKLHTPVLRDAEPAAAPIPETA